MIKDRQLKRLRWAVRGVLVLGVAASVTANILHAQSNPISQAIAAWPPIALLLTVELISRVPIHRRGLATARITATITIAGIAAWVSYWHMTGVAARYGERGTSPYLLPLSVDGLIIVASVCLIELTGRIAEPTTNQPQHTGANNPIAGITQDEPARRDTIQTKVQPSVPLRLKTSPVVADQLISSRGPEERPVHSQVASAQSQTTPPYQPSSDDDAAMYQLWCLELATGHEPSGPELARATGRLDDASGIGRRAARRYRAVHAQSQPALPPAG